MPLLIDGHNLIGQMPDLDLEDPDDEAKLVARLRTYCARARKRATVVFDHGLPGGRSLPLSGGGVEVVFASAGRKADGILCERLRRARDPRGLTVVSSDGEVLAAARARHARVIRSEDFALQLSSPRSVETDEAARDRPISSQEVEEWLSLFGAEGKDREKDKR